MFNGTSLNWNPDARTLRQFGFIALFGFTLCAYLAWHERAMFSVGLGAARPGVSVGFLILAALSLLFALIFPRGNRPVYLGLSLLSYPIGFVMSYVMLGLMFALVIGPISLLLRLFRRDPLAMRRDETLSSYWTARKRAADAESYFRQF